MIFPTGNVNINLDKWLAASLQFLTLECYKAVAFLLNGKRK